LTSILYIKENAPKGLYAMPEDTTGRIVLAVETANAEKKISAVKNELEGVSEQQTKNLQLAKLRTAAEKDQVRMEQLSVQIKKAELELVEAVRRRAFARKKGADTKEMAQYTEAVEKAKLELVTLHDVQAATALQLDQTNNAMKKLGSSTSGAQKEIKKFSWAQLAAKSAARAFHMELGEGSNMIKMGIIAAGAASAMKILQFALSRASDAMQYKAKIASENTQSLQSVIERNKELRDEENKTLSALEQLNQKERVTNVDKLEMIKLLERLGGGYSKYGIEIDKVTGKITNLDEVSGKAAEKQRQKRLKEINMKEKELRIERKELTSLVDNSGMRIKEPNWWWSLASPLLVAASAVHIPSSQEIREGEKATERLNKMGEEQMKLTAERKRLEKENPLEDARKKEEARLKDLQDKYDTELKTGERAIEIQRLKNQGKEREAKLLEIQTQLEKERLTLSGKQLNVFDKNKDKRIKNFMAQYDEQQAGKVERERREAMKKNQDAMKSAFSQIQKEFNQFRNTSQQSIMSGSVEAMRLRSRRFVNSGGVDYAQMTAEYNKTQVKTLGDILKEMTAATNKLTNISTSGVPIKGLSVRSH
jgi:hypothetical protein